MELVPRDFFPFFVEGTQSNLPGEQEGNVRTLANFSWSSYLVKIRNRSSCHKPVLVVAIKFKVKFMNAVRYQIGILYVSRNSILFNNFYRV